MKRKRKNLILPAVILVSLALLVCIGQRLYLRIKYPYHFALASELSITFKELEKYAGARDRRVERHFGMMVESARRNWDRVAELVDKGDKSILCCYFYNLANAMNGKLGERLLSRYQPYWYGLFIPVNEKTAIPDLLASGEVWYQLGEMTMAEHNTILAMIYSPAHEGSRFYRRLAEINSITGDEGAVRKYTALLGDTLDVTWREKKPFIQKKDIVHLPNDIRPILKGLLESNPENIAAYEYLLCYDLLKKDIPAFMEDYVPGRKECRLYQEGALVFLGSKGDVSQERRRELGITDDVFANFNRYNDSFNACGANPDVLAGAYGRTYWYYFHFVQLNENAKGI